MWNEIKTVYWRVVGVMRLDPQTIAELHADPKATYQAVVVVFLSSLMLAVHVQGAWLAILIVPLRFMVWWIVGAYVIYLIGNWLLSTKDSPPTAFAPLARGIGFAMAPGILQIFLFIESFAIGQLIQYLSIAWMFAAMAVSTHIALGRPSYTRVTIIIALAMLPVIILEPFLLGGQG